MRYRKMGKSDLEVSVVGHGTWGLGNDFFGEVDEKTGIAAIHQSMDLGVNLIDTAPAYGQNFESEITVGKAIKGRRDKAVISTKFGIHRIMGDYVKCLSPMLVRKEIENSLSRLGTDYIDIYMVHWPDYNHGIEGALDVLAELKKEGKVRETAVSNFSIEEIDIAVQRAGIVCVQPPMSLLDRSSVENGVIPHCNKENIGIMTYGSLGGGILTGTMEKPLVSEGKELRSGFYNYFGEPMWTKCNQLIDTLREVAAPRGVPVAQVAINWTLAQPGVTTVLMGSSKPSTAKNSAAAADWEMTPEEVAIINASYDKIFKD